jgi:hypothetical protein
MKKAVVKHGFKIFVLFVVLSLISPSVVSGTDPWGGATPPFIFEGTVRNMVKQQEYVGSTYDVFSKDWNMTFQVSVMPGYGQVDDGIQIGDSVQVCGERGKGIEQTSVKLNKGNHYIKRTGPGASTFSPQSNTPVIGNINPPQGQNTREFCPVCICESLVGPKCCICKALAMTEPEDAPKLTLLRTFRDRVLRSSDVGNAFIFFYYHILSPVAIAALAGNEPAIQLLRLTVIEPIVWAVTITEGSWNN